MAKIETTTNAEATKIDRHKATATVLAKATKRNKMAKGKIIKAVTVKTCQKQQNIKPWHKNLSFHPSHRAETTEIETMEAKAMVAEVVAVETTATEAVVTEAVETEAIAATAMATDNLSWR